MCLFKLVIPACTLMFPWSVEWCRKMISNGISDSIVSLLFSVIGCLLSVIPALNSECVSRSQCYYCYDKGYEQKRVDSF